VAALAITDAKVAAANKDGAAGTPSMRTLGTGAAQAAAGNDARFTPAVGRCQMTNTAAQAFSDGGMATVAFNTVVSGSTSGMGDTANNRIVIQTAGLYHLEVQVWMAGATTTSKLLRLLINGIYTHEVRVMGVGATAGQQVHGIEWLSAGDVIVANIQNNGQAISTVVVGSTNYSSMLSANLLRT
jgi:hypothetical protein